MGRLTEFEAAQLLKDSPKLDDIRAKTMVYTECKRIEQRIRKNLERLKVSPHGKEFSGRLERSIHWAVFLESGGNVDKCVFYTIEYHRYVELAVQKGYKLRQGGMPQQIASSEYGRIAVDRRRGHRRLHRKAAPFFGGEIRLHMRGLTNALIKYFGYTMGAKLYALSLDGQDAESRIFQWESTGSILYGKG